MKYRVILLSALTVIFGFGCVSAQTNEKMPEKTIYDFNMTDIDGKQVNLGAYKNKVALIVNTASKCGYTPQYEALQNVYDKYKDKGFTILGFPANNFGGQEPGSNEEIKEFCTLKFKVSFPMFAKISVKGEDQDAFYNFLTGENAKFPGDITWNFEKFLVNGNGEIIARFAPKIKPDAPEVIEAIEKALNEKTPSNNKMAKNLFVFSNGRFIYMP